MNFFVGSILLDSINSVDKNFKRAKNTKLKKIQTHVELAKREVKPQLIKIESNSKKSMYHQVQEFRMLGKNFIAKKKKKEKKKYQKKKIKKEKGRIVFAKFSCANREDRKGISNEQKKRFDFYKDLNTKREKIVNEYDLQKKG